MSALIVPESIPLYEDVDPDELREAAQEIRAAGAEYAKDAAGMDRAWNAGTDASYVQGAAKPTLLELLHPVARRAVPVDQACQQVAKAVDVYADAAEKVQKRLKADADDFVARMKRLEAHGEKWDQYPANVAENEGLQKAVGKQEAAFVEAESTCAGSIDAAYGADSGMAAPPPGHPAGMPLPGEMEKMGREAADLAKKAAAGDEKAFQDLMAYKGLEKDPVFATSFTRHLGAGGLIKTAIGLGADGPQQPGKPHGTKLSADQVKAAMAMMAGAVATATGPAAGRAGADLLDDLKRQGREKFAVPVPAGEHTGAGQKVFGYQALGMMLKVGGEGGTKFSPEFMKTVGRDMIDFDKELTDNGTRVTPALEKGLGIRGAGDPFTAMSTSRLPYAEPSRYLEGLMEAAGSSGKDSAQTLLKGNLGYLIGDRGYVWGHGDQGKSLGQALETATSGQDKTSKALTFDAAKAYGKRVDEIVDVGSDGKLTFRDPPIGLRTVDEIDELAGMRQPFSRVLDRHWDDVAESFTAPGLAEHGDLARTKGLSYTFLDLARDEKAFENLMRAQTAHTKEAFGPRLDTDPTTDNDNRDTRVLQEAQMFGRLLAARGISHGIQIDQNLKADAELARMVNYGVGLIPIMPSGDLGPVGGALVKAGGEFTENLYKTLAKEGYGAAGGLLAEHAGQDGSPDIPNRRKGLYADLTNAQSTVKSMIVQNLAVNAADHGTFPVESLKEKEVTFADPDRPGRVLPYAEMDGDQRRDYLTWIAGRKDFQYLLGLSASEFGNGADEARGHLGLPIPSLKNE